MGPVAATTSPGGLTSVQSLHNEQVNTSQNAMGTEVQAAENAGETQKDLPTGGEKKTKAAIETVRGKPVSGRAWKVTQTKRHSAMRPKMLRPGWVKQQEDRKKREIVKTIEKELKDQKIAAKQKKREEEKERQKRKEENEKRAEVVQQVSAAKLKRMKKKQLRQLRKQ
ncbi:uncharacterized protein SPPG_02332 [Spizellomyces punctatus DAOM BR117]|uniref:Coiled-coil domain-containing protein 86 n=1 Tax=Spizellomyces punctatus (strain DAOM BR117) TaxID=645134 RepID=A0A0L0HPF0_SPIPD|nr:uncharacterized protein SPPG_02332 [Spizellomyces punctatus DAOM BR117]KND03281.1 hypothetical protein SPPG_02332 [Spizellomyces punctatus DAOM BR117]|eukprot:XP_016611320.1 hypothetical protein SPPG_02332 [Spizellomyces punctatus DAOM BR117]